MKNLICGTMDKDSVIAYRLLLAKRCLCERNLFRDWHILSDHVYSESSWSIVLQSSSGITEDDQGNGLGHNLSGKLTSEHDCTDPLCLKQKTTTTNMVQESPDVEISDDDGLNLLSAIDGCEKALWVMDQVSRPEQIQDLLDQPNQWDGSYDNADNIGRSNPLVIHGSSNQISRQHNRTSTQCPVPWYRAGKESLEMNATCPENSNEHVPSLIGHVEFLAGSLLAEIDLAAQGEVGQPTTIAKRRKQSSQKRNRKKTKTVSVSTEMDQGNQEKPDSKTEEETNSEPSISWIFQCLITCTKCEENKQYAFRFRKVMSRHRRIQDKGIHIHCTVCDSITLATAKIDKVGKNINDNDHLPKPIFACDMCTMVEFDDLLDWALHDKKHIKDPHKCLTCGAVSPSRFGLSRHMLRMHAPKKLCEVCGVFYTYDNHHQIAGHADKYQCSHCGEEFTTRTYLTRHIRRHHETLEPHMKTDYLCNVCGKKFVAYSTFYQHEMNHKLGKHKCDICGKEYINGRCLKRHLHIHHGGNRKKFNCKYCGKVFVSVKGIQIHEETQHGNPDERPVYSCEVCGKKFKSKNGFEIHSKNHTSMK